MTDDITPYNQTTLSNVFTVNGDVTNMPPTIIEKLNTVISVGLMLKESRLNVKEFQFIVNSMKINSALVDMGRVFARTMKEKGESETYSDDYYNQVFSGKAKLTFKSDTMFRTMLLMSVMDSGSKELIILAKHMVKIVHLTPADIKTLPVVSDSMYTITVDVASVMVGVEMGNAIMEIAEKYKKPK